LTPNVAALETSFESISIENFPLIRSITIRGALKATIGRDWIGATHIECSGGPHFFHCEWADIVVALVGMVNEVEEENFFF
jgi:hypothetical protein